MSDTPRAYSVYADDPFYVALVKERAELHAEIERLTILLKEADKGCAALLEQREAEIEWLRAVTDAILAYREAAADAGNPMWPWPALEIALDAVLRST